VHVGKLLAGALAEGGESQVRIAIEVKAGGDEHAVNINAGNAVSARGAGLESPAWGLVVGTDTLPIWLGQLSRNLVCAQGTLRGSMGGPGCRQ